MSTGQGELSFDGEKDEVESGPDFAAMHAEVHNPTIEPPSIAERSEFDPNARRAAGLSGFADKAQIAADEKERVGGILETTRENLDRIRERDERDYPKPEDPK